MDSKQLHGPVASLLRCTMALVAFAAGAPAFAECLRAPLSNGAVGFMLRQHANEPGKAAEIADALAQMVMEQLSYAPSRHANAEAMVKAYVPLLLADAKDASAFNAGLSEFLAGACGRLGAAPATAPATVRIAAAVAPRVESEQVVDSPPIEEEEAGAEGEDGGEGTGNGEETPSSDVQPDENVDDVLKAKLKIAQAAYNGTDVLPKPPVGKSKDKNAKDNDAKDDDAKSDDAASVEALFAYHNVMLGCKDSAKPQDVCDASNADEVCGCKKLVESARCRGLENDSAKCSRNIFNAIRDIDTTIATQLEAAKALRPTADQTLKIARLKAESAWRHTDAIENEGVRNAFWGMYAGPNFTLQDGGDWKNGLEVYTSFQTEAFDRNACPWARICRGFFDASFVTPDAFPTEVEDGEELPVAVFDSKGRVRLRAGYQWHWTKWLGLEAGIGVTSPIPDEQISVRAEPRAHIGAHLQTVYADRAIGELFVGYARDKSWERLVDLDGSDTTTDDRLAQQRFDRVLLEGTILFPRVELGGFSLAARISADIPWSGDSQSELRASILFYYPFTKWLDKFRPTVKAAEEGGE